MPLDPATPSKENAEWRMRNEKPLQPLMDTDKHIVSAGPLGAPTSPSAPPPPFRHSHSAFPIPDLLSPIFCRTAASPALKTEPLKTENSSPPSVLRPPLSVLHRKAAFTLIELLVVIAVIAILAGITLAAMGGVNEKAARDRTSGDIAAISTALEVYRSRFDAYPPPTNTDRLPFLAIAPFFETRTSQTNANLLLDVYGQEFRYRNPGQRNPATFDLWSVGKNRSTNDHIGNW
jgi:general secretion pathway protein G